MLAKSRHNRTYRTVHYLSLSMLVVFVVLCSSCADKPAYADSINTSAVAAINRQVWAYHVFRIDVDKRTFSYYNDTVFPGDLSALQEWESNALDVLDSNHVNAVYTVGQEMTFVFCSQTPGTKGNGGFVLLSGPDAAADLESDYGQTLNRNLVLGESNDSLCWFGMYEWRESFGDYIIGAH